MKSKLLTITLYLFTHILLHAQVVEKRTVEVSIATVKLLPEHSRIRLHSSSEDIILHNRYFSEPQNVEIAITEPLKFYVAGEDVVPGETKELGAVTIPASAKKGIILLLPKNDKYTGLFVDATEFPKGGVFIINHTQHSLGFDIGDEKIAIDSKGVHAYKPDSKESMEVGVKIYTSPDRKKWKRFYASKWRVVPNRREVLIFYQKKLNGPVLTKGMTQYIKKSD